MKQIQHDDVTQKKTEILCLFLQPSFKPNLFKKEKVKFTSLFFKILERFSTKHFSELLMKIE
jgi:hypothetical protein